MILPRQVWLAIEAVDMRLGIDGLSLRVQEALGRAPCDGGAVAFRNQRGNRLKLLAWDGTGVWLAQRRLHRAHSGLPRHRPGKIQACSGPPTASPLKRTRILPEPRWKNSAPACTHKPPHPPAIRLPRLRDRHRRAGAGRGH